MTPRHRAQQESKGREMQPIPELRSRLKDLFQKQYFSLVAFSVSDDLRLFLFSTPRSTRKFRYLSQNPEVSLLVDDRSNEITDIERVTAVSIAGRAAELAGGQRIAMLGLHLAKHPSLEKFARSPNSALVVVTVRRYGIVTSFQSIVMLAPEEV